LGDPLIQPLPRGCAAGGQFCDAAANACSPLCCVSLSPLASVCLARLLSVGWLVPYVLASAGLELGAWCRRLSAGAAGRSSVASGLLMPCRLSARAFGSAIARSACSGVGLARSHSLVLSCRWAGFAAAGFRFVLSVSLTGLRLLPRALSGLARGQSPSRSLCYIRRRACSASLVSWLGARRSLCRHSRRGSRFARVDVTRRARFCSSLLRRRFCRHAGCLRRLC